MEEIKKEVDTKLQELATTLIMQKSAFFADANNAMGSLLDKVSFTIRSLEWLNAFLMPVNAKGAAVS